MVEIRPFKGHYYNLQKIGIAPEKLVAPPFDVISEEMRAELSAEPWNICNIMLGNRNDAYASAAKKLGEWIKEETITQDKAECYYLYEQTFGFEGKSFQRLGLIALLRLEPLGKNILPHEKTHPKTMIDRYELLSAVRGNIEQIFMIYEDKKDSLRPILERVRQPFNEILSFNDPDGVRHRIFRIPRPADVAEITRMMSRRQLLIADGHHRYETALRYASEQDKKAGEGPHDYVLATLVNSYDPGLIMLPTHRLLHSIDRKTLEGLERKLKKRFEVRKTRDRVHLLGLLEGAVGCNSLGIWLIKENIGYLATLKDEFRSDDPVDGLDVSILHKYVIEEIFGITEEMQEHKEKIEFVKGTEESFRFASENDYDVICLLNPSSVPEIFDAAKTGKKLPHKSTYFFPKVWSGVVMRFF
ncbi:MAG: DUF1015 domain-containing protein [Thermoplasmata archaeon]